MAAIGLPHGSHVQVLFIKQRVGREEPLLLTVSFDFLQNHASLRLGFV